MKLKKCFTQALLITVFLLYFSPLASAALFTIDIDGLPVPDSGIQSFSVWLSVDDQFAFSNFIFGDALTSGGTIGWDTQTDAVLDPTRGRVFKIGGLDQDGLYLGNRFDLSNGLICTFDYEGLILGLTDIVQFSDPAGVNQLENLGLLAEFTETGLHIAPVPIPSAVLLLGSGILGMLGIRRKFNK